MSEPPIFNDLQRAALKEVVKAKLKLWDASTAAEKLLGEPNEIDTGGVGLEALCIGLDTVEEVDQLSDEILAEAFELKEFKQLTLPLG